MMAITPHTPGMCPVTKRPLDKPGSYIPRSKR